MRFMFIYMISLLSISSLFTQTNLKQIAVLNLSASGLSPSESITLTDRLRSELVNTREFRVIERDKMEEILVEQGFQQSGCTSDECAVEIGKLLNIHQICAGSVGKVGSLYSVILRLIDVETGQILATVTEDCSCPIEQILTTSMHSLADKLVVETTKYPGLFVAKGGKGDLYLKSSLTPARIFIDGQPMPDLTPTTIKNLPSGEHVIKVIKDDFAGSKVVIINPEEILEDTISMSKAKGGVKVYSTPAEADIFIADQYQGKTPKIIKDITAGEHLVLISKTGYSDIKRKIKIEPEEYSELDITLVRPAQLSISSEPSNALVKIFGQEMGNTPLHLNDIYPGKVYIEIYFPGYKTEGAYVQLSEASVSQKHYILNRLPVLKVESDPAGAGVYVNNNFKGNTPLNLTDLTDDKIRLLLKKNYFNDWQKDILLQSGINQQVSAKLTFQEGILAISSEPANQEVAINGVPAGKTPFDLTMPYGEYDLSISEPTYEPINELIILNAARLEKIYKLNYRKSSIKFNGIPDEAVCTINGKKFAGDSSEFTMPVGFYKIQVSKTGYKSYTEKFNLQTNQPHNIQILMTPKNKMDAFLRSSVVPGWGQAYQEKTLRTWLYPAVIIGLGTASFITTSTYNDKVSSYEQIRQDYLAAFDPLKINELRKQMHDAYDQVEQTENIRNIFYISTGLVWLWNMLDTIFLPPAWQKKIQLSSGINDSKNSVGLSIKIPE